MRLAPVWKKWLYSRKIEHGTHDMVKRTANPDFAGMVALFALFFRFFLAKQGQ